MAEENQQGRNEIGPLTMIVCIKQVPLVSAMRFDQEARRLVREGVPLEINELDVYALSEAIHLRDTYGGEVIAMTMGPPQAREALATALAMGADHAIHLNDRAFAGADTMATARVLAAAIQHVTKTQQKAIDIIFCGRHSVDAETAQVGAEIAEMLAIPQVSAVQKLHLERHNDRRQVIATRELDEGSETIAASLPVLLTAAERLNKGIWPDEHAIHEAEEHADDRLHVLTAAGLKLDDSLIGQRGSPTWVATVEADTHTRKGQVILESDPERAIEQLLEQLETQSVLNGQQPTSHQPQRTSLEGMPRRQGEPLPGKAVWVIAERSLLGERDIRRVTLELLGKGNELAVTLQGELAAVLPGGAGVRKLAATLAAHGAERIYVVEHPALEDYTTEGYTAVVSELIRRYTPAVVLFGSTDNGRDLAPRVAARLSLGLTGDCIDLAIDEQQRLVQYKPAFGGSIISSILSHTTPAMATLRPGILQVIQQERHRTPVIEQVMIDNLDKMMQTRIIARDIRSIDIIALDDAHTVIGIGMGVGEPANYDPVQRLARLLHAAIGATRNVTDQGWMPKQQQIGLTGHAVSPRLYIALGIRGAAEHIAGIRKAEFVVSINKNKRAAIFKYSDLGVVGDVKVLLPLLVNKLEQRMQS